MVNSFMLRYIPLVLEECCQTGIFKILQYHVYALHLLRVHCPLRGSLNYIFPTTNRLALPYDEVNHGLALIINR